MSDTRDSAGSTKLTYSLKTRYGGFFVLKPYFLLSAKFFQRPLCYVSVPYVKRNIPMTGLILGFLLGFIMQRGRFCMAGGLRDVYLFKDYRMVIAILIAISIQSAGLLIFVPQGLAALPTGPFFWLATVVGGVLFGAGMSFAGSCSTGAYYRAAEGLAGSLLAVVGFIISSWFIRHTAVKPLIKPLKDYRTEAGAITDTLHIAPWLAALALCLLTLYLAWRHLNKPALPVAKLKARRTGMAHLLFEARWHPFVSAALIGVVALLAWVSSLASGRPGGLGISGPSAQLFSLIFEGKSGFFGWAGYLLMGIVLGALLAAAGSRELKFRYPGHLTAVKSLAGGLLMGVGSGLAGGCMLGNTLVNTAWFSWQGWVFIPAIFVGSWFISYFTLIRPMNLNTVNNG
jgi:uncharacterized membrane protein YedE/YeeE